MHDLFKTVKNGTVNIWYIGEPICTSCKEELSYHTAYCILDWNPKGSSRQILCEGCLGKIKPLVYAQDRFLVYCVEELPPGSIPIFPRPPNLAVARGDLTVFEADKIKSEKTQDHTKHSSNSFFGSDSKHGFIVGSPNMALINRYDKPLTEKEGIKLLEDSKK